MKLFLVLIFNFDNLRMK